MNDIEREIPVFLRVAEPDVVTLHQLQQLYKMGVLSVGQCANILNIRNDSVRQKFSRLKKGEVENLELQYWQRDRLISVLQDDQEMIANILNQEAK